MKKYFVLTGLLFMFGFLLMLTAQSEEKLRDAYDNVYKTAQVKDGVREISYGEFMAIRSSGEPYVLLDVLSADSYKNGHIEGALSFPVGAITKTEAEKRISKDANVIVYCGGFLCSASTSAANKLDSFGYKVLDYKGGLEEWQGKGNSLEAAK